MSNTVLLSGKGAGVHIFFLRLLESFPEASLYQPELRWWQSTPRHELRLQNVTNAEIMMLESITTMFWPMSSAIKIQVF